MDGTLLVIIDGTLLGIIDGTLLGIIDGTLLGFSEGIVEGIEIQSLCSDSITMSVAMITVSYANLKE